MKAIKRERQITETYTEYEAIDGTIFSSKEECEKYDKSAECVLQLEYKKLILKNMYECDLLELGCEDNPLEVVAVRSKEDVELLKKMMFFYNDYYSKMDPKDYPDWFKDDLNEIDNALKNKDVLFVGRGYDRDGFWIYGSTKSICDKICEHKKLLNVKTESKPEPEYGGC